MCDNCKFMKKTFTRKKNINTPIYCLFGYLGIVKTPVTIAVNLGLMTVGLAVANGDICQ